ncbi:hypothetical protein [Pseudoalteromonas sp. RB2-MNA-CIBAN-0110]|uniref:hypothetical protein n=1 Tax=Pseudoalteromonas sp. RB2-MNA-CIBAN-0110 TaxID=3140439 RepID=UPI0004643524
MKHSLSTLTKVQYTKAKLEWNQLKPPFSMQHINRCVILATKIIFFKGKENLKQGTKKLDTKRLSKYEAQHSLRIIFTLSNIVPFYSILSKSFLAPTETSSLKWFWYVSSKVFYLVD